MNNKFFNPLEVMGAATDSLAMRLGVKVSNPHPIADALTLQDIAYAAGATSKNNMRAAGASDVQVMALGLATGDFSRPLAEAAAQLIVRTYQNQLQHGSFCSEVLIRNFQPATVPAIDADVALEPLADGAEISHSAAVVAAGSSSARLTTFAKIIGISRQALVNDDLEGFARLAVDLGASGARLEARLVAEALESNLLLDDGLTAFDLVGDAHNNVVALTLSGANLGIAMGKLRTQLSASGMRLDLAAKHLVVSAEQEFLARSILADFGLDISVHVLSYLPVGRWFVLADKTIHPTIGTLRLNKDPSPFRAVVQNRRPDKYDGAAVRVIADLGAVLVSRTGIVRGGA